MARKRANGRKRRAEESFVLDASIALAWGFEDETNAYADAVLDRLSSNKAIVPALWPLEVANALLTAERRGRSSEADTARLIRLLKRLPVSFDDETNARALTDTLSLARRHGLSPYDAAYVELAVRRGLPLATIDRGLSAAIAAIGVALYDVI